MTAGSEVPLRMRKTFGVEPKLLLPLEATQDDSFSEKEKKGKKGKGKEDNGKIREEKESSSRRAVI